MIYEILLGILFIIFGILLIIDSLTYKFSRAFDDQNFSGWLMGIIGIVGGIYIIVTTLLGK